MPRLDKNRANGPGAVQEGVTRCFLCDGEPSHNAPPVSAQVERDKPSACDRGSPDTRPPPDVVAARLAEVDRHYRSLQKRKEGRGGGNLRLGELRRLFRHRGVSSEGIGDAIREAVGDPLAWTAGQLGQHLELTFEEKIRLGIRTIRCFDRPLSEVKEYYAVKRRERDRRRARLRRAERRAAQSPPVKRQNALRVSAVRTALYQTSKLGPSCIGAQWASVAMIVRLIKRKRVFRNIDQAASRRAVHRALKSLAPELEVKQLCGLHGNPVNWYRLKRPPS